MVNTERGVGSSQIKDVVQKKGKQQVKWKRDSFAQSGEVWLQAGFMHLFKDEISGRQARGNWDGRNNIKAGVRRIWV